jgi:hypothetical protein
MEQGSSTALSSASESSHNSVLNELRSTVTRDAAQPIGSTVSSVPNATPLESALSINTAPSKVKSTPPKVEAPLQAPLTQSALAKRLGCSDKAIEKQRKYGSKENFVAWSRERDPDYIGWTWAGRAIKGQPLRFLPAT